jgi:hypothetical protein
VVDVALCRQPRWYLVFPRETCTGGNHEPHAFYCTRFWSRLLHHLSYREVEPLETTCSLEHDAGARLLSGIPKQRYSRVVAPIRAVIAPSALSGAHPIFLRYSGK